MADTQRTLSAILTLLADNTAQAISAQDLRDAIVSVFANYGMIYVHGGSTAQSGVTTSVVMDGFQNDGANGPSAGCVTVDKDTSKLTAGVDGVYLVWLHTSFNGSVATGYHIHGQKNGSDHMDELAGDFDTPSASVTMSVSSVALVTLSANDYIQPMIEADSSSNIILEDGQFGMIKVG